jgi:5-methylcytosine-specific restriction endonuclease McrA
LLLAIVRTDSSFALTERNGKRYWLGKCIYCNTSLAVEEDGSMISLATVEHLRPRNHGGTDDLKNLAISCRECNQSKGSRIDNRRKGDARMEEVIEESLERRKARWREG